MNALSILPGNRDSLGADHRRPATWKSWSQLAILAALLALLYYRIVADLAVEWWSNPNYSHGFLIPIFCGWMIWKQRKHLTDESVRPNRLGFALIGAALGMLVLGVLGAELFLSRVSLILFLAGVVIYFRGWSHFRRILFPWALLFLAVPLPAIVFNQIALPLQFQASKLATGLLSLCGVPVLREGNVINLPSLSLDVVEACSGLRSLVSLITLALLYGYFFERRNWVRVLLALSAIPIAVAANGVRIMGSGLLGEYWDPSKAEGFFHLFSGWLIFVLSIVLIVGLHAAIVWAVRPHKLQERVA